MRIDLKAEKVRKRIIAMALNIDRCPCARSDGAVGFRCAGEAVPGLATGIDNVGAGFKDAVAEEILAQVLPDIFAGINLWTVGQQVQEADSAGNDRFVARLVPAGG